MLAPARRTKTPAEYRIVENNFLSNRAPIFAAPSEVTRIHDSAADTPGHDETEAKEKNGNSSLPSRFC